MRSAALGRLGARGGLRSALRALGCALPALLAAGCGDSTGPEPAGTPRLLAITPSPRTTPPPGVDDYIAAVDSVAAAGARGQNLFFPWSALESSPGNFTMNDFIFTVRYLGIDRGFSLYINIAVVNTTVKETPADLDTVPFDSPQMRTRFRALVDELSSAVNEHVVYIGIGNEVDAYLAQANAWSAYRAFYEDAAAYVRSKLRNVRVGVCVTHAGATGPFADSVAALAATSDVWITTFYPTDATFHPTGPSAGTAVLPEMVARAGGRPVIVQEIGYPSSPVLGSSEDDQAAFYGNVLAAWPATGGAIPFLNVFMLHDFPTTTCDDLAAYYGLSGNASFKAFLCSLGLLRTDGTAKAAWDSVKAGAARALAGASP